MPDIGTPAVQSNHTHVKEPDADRRLVFVARNEWERGQSIRQLTFGRYRYTTDLDCWNLLAIIATASESQGDHLRDFIYRHIEFKTFVGVQVSV